MSGEDTMSAIAIQREERRQDTAPQDSGLCCGQPSGSYHELSPHEFHARKDLGVVVLKASAAAGEFADFRAVYSLAGSNEIEAVLADWPRNLAIGIVCQNGECSGRLAIRLSKRGYQVYHLAGGLREWRQCCFAS